MNCDTAFDLMTDPHGSRSGALAEHFATCTRCRQMQETLAPALEFLMHDEASAEPTAAVREVSAAQEESRQPFVTVDSVKVAQQVAARLTAQAELPRLRRQRLAGRALRYAAVFAAGLLVALILVSDRKVEQPNSADHCTRHAAASDSTGRSAEAIQALARSCAVCHTADPGPKADQQTSLLRSERVPNWDWLSRFLTNEYRPLDDSRILAGSTSHCLQIAADRLV